MLGYLDSILGYISSINITILTAHIIFYTLTNLRLTLRKRTQSFIEALKGIKNDSEEVTIRNFIDEVITETRPKQKKLVVLLHKMGVSFRTSIYLSMIAIIGVLIFKIDPLPILAKWIIGIIIIISSSISFWILITNIHQFKYIYHYDIESNIESIISIVEYLEKGLIDKAFSEYKQLKEIGMMKTSIPERLKYLKWYNPFK